MASAHQTRSRFDRNPENGRTARQNGVVAVQTMPRYESAARLIAHFAGVAVRGPQNKNTEKIMVHGSSAVFVSRSMQSCICQADEQYYCLKFCVCGVHSSRFVRSSFQRRLFVAVESELRDSVRLEQSCRDIEAFFLVGCE